MSRLTIDTGTAGNPATGDSLLGAFTKVNTNFAELYAELGGDSLDAISFTNNTISTDITNANLILTGNGTGGVVIEDIEITGSTVNVLTTNNNLTLNTNGTGKVVINGLSFPTTDGTAGQVLKTDGAGNLSFTAVDPGAITIVGDDSTGTAVNIGETFKIAGAGTVTTAVSGDTLTITGTSSSTGDFTFSGNILSTASSNADMELDPSGTGNLILKSGNFLPAADNTQYLGSANKRWHTLYVGPGSINVNGVTISESAGKLNIPGGFTGTQGLASIILPDPSSLPYGGQNDNQGNPFLFANDTVFLDQHTYLYIQGKVAAGGIWAGWTVGTGYPEALGFTPANFTHTHSNGALTQLTLASGGSGLSVAATDNIMAFRNGDPITTTLASPYAGILGTVDAQGSSQDTLTTINQLTAGGTFTAQDQSLFFDNINLQTGTNIIFSDSTTQNTAARITVVGDDSTGTTFNAGETIRIAGTQNITTAVAGDTLTITGPDLSSYITDNGLGDLTVVGSTIQSPSNADITLDPSGTGAIRLHSDVKMKPATSITIGEPSEEVYRIWTQSLYVALNGLSNSYTGIDYEGINFSNSTYGGHITFSNYADINSAYNSTFRNSFGNNFIIRTSPGKDFVLTSENGIGGEPQSAIRVHAADNRVNINDISISGTTIQTETTNADLTLQGNGTGGVNVSGTLTANIFVTNAISSGDSTAIQINDAVNVSGAGTFHGSVRFNAGYTEKINALTSSSTITVNCATASIHTVTLAVSTGFVISNLPTGGTVTVIITQGGSGSYTATFGTDGSTTVKFPGGAPTLSTAVGAIDVVTIFNDGTNYLGNIAKAYAA